MRYSLRFSNFILWYTIKKETENLCIILVVEAGFKPAPTISPLLLVPKFNLGTRGRLWRSQVQLGNEV
jgi:hypothetical protein